MPVNALAEDGVPPEEGDSVSFSVEGKVQSVDGGSATVSIDSINGEPVGEESSESPAEEQGEEKGEGATPPTPGAGGGAGPEPPTPVAASGPANPGPMGAAPPGAGMGLARNRMNRAATNLMGQNLRKKAKGNPMPF